MTGEMGWKDLKDYSEMQELTRMIRQKANVAAQLRPFDVYQGPYIAVDLYGSPKKHQLGSWNTEVWQVDNGKFVVRGGGPHTYFGPHTTSRPMTGPQVVAWFARKVNPGRSRTVRAQMKKTPQRSGKRCIRR